MNNGDAMSEETRDGLTMAGIPIIQLDPPAKQTIRTKSGELKTVITDGWIKFGIAFRNELPKMEGASLSVFMCICLHVNTEREAWPNLNTICLETNHARATVVKAIKHLKKMGLLEVAKISRRRSNTYRPLYAAYGSGSIIELPTVQLLNSNGSIIEPEVEPGRITKEEESSRKREVKPRKSNPIFDAIALTCGPKDPELLKSYIKTNSSWIAKVANNGCGEYPSEKIVEWYTEGGWYYKVHMAWAESPAAPTPAIIQKTIHHAAQWEKDRAEAPGVTVNADGSMYV